MGVVYKEYKNFDELYEGIFKEFLYEKLPNLYIDGFLPTVENLFISCNSYDCTLQPKDVLFKPITRWKYLCNNYVDYGEWLVFKSLFKSKKQPSSRTFRFNTKKAELCNDNVIRVKNGPCLISMTLSVNNGRPSKKFNRVDIVIRNSQVESKLLFDLILINRILTELDEFECVDIQRINFHMISAFLNPHYTSALLALNNYSDKFFGNGCTFTTNKTLIDYYNEYLKDISYKDYQGINSFKYNLGRRYYVYYSPEGVLQPIKLKVLEKLKYSYIYEERHKFINIDYDYLQLDGSYGKIDDIDSTDVIRSNFKKQKLW